MLFRFCAIMDTRVILICIIAVVNSRAVEYPNNYYKTQIGGQTDSRGDTSNGNAEFVSPVQYSVFKRHQPTGFQPGHPVRRTRSTTEATPPEDYDAKPAAFVEPVHFISTFNSDGSKDNANKIRQYLDQTPKASDSVEDFDDNEERSSFLRSEVPARTFRHLGKPNRSQGKSSYPSKEGKGRTDAAAEYYSSLYAKKDDVELILPKEDSIILPMVNGKPKPYDGYRAASDVRPYERRQPRYREEIVYGKPKRGVSYIPPYRAKRAPAEYHGGIYPHFDYSDPENADRLVREPKETHQKKKTYPKKHRSKSSTKPHNYYKYPKGNRKAIKRSSSEEEDDEDEEKEEEETPAYKYKYDNTFVIPELTVKYYPYEKYVTDKDSKEEGTDEEKSYEPPVDEYTAGYEAYKKSFMSDLEKHFGQPDFGDYTVEATENLENNSNCQKLTQEPKISENAAEDGKNENATEVCYLCRDPKTGGSYEQCAYQTAPKLERYFFGGTKTFKANDSAEPVSYRYKRSAFTDDFDLDRLIFGSDSEVKRNVRENVRRGHDRPRKEAKKKKKDSWGFDADEEQEDRYPSFYRKNDHDGSSSSKRTKKSKNKENPPDSYDGPRYTYEGPLEPYEGPSETYEGPAETYEGPIHKDYYISSDDRIEDDVDESQNKPKKTDYYDYQTYHPKQKYESGRDQYEEEPKREYTEDRHFKPSRGYQSEYRFGPEHFVDDEEVEEENKKAEVKREPKPKPVERKQKRPEKETRQAQASEPEEKDVGNVKVFKNGDVCRKKKVDGMICMVCKNEKTAATYEQCQYSSKPKDKYYAYGSQKSYRTSDPREKNPKNTEEDQYPEKSDVVEKKILITKQSKIFQDDSGPLDALPRTDLNGDLLGAPSDNEETRVEDPNNENDNRKVSESIMRVEPRDGIEGLEEYLYSDGEKPSDESREYKSYDEYFHDIFPEFAHSGESRESDEESEEESEESESEHRAQFDPFSNVKQFKEENPAFLEYSPEEEDGDGGSAEASNEEPQRLKDRKSRVPPDFFAEDSEEYHKKDIEKALGEFQSRDWSNCKKIMKKKLTCYQCVDKNGVNNEECMYVEGSEPKKQHLSYHERKQLRPEQINVQTDAKPQEILETSTTSSTESAVTDLTKIPRRFRKPKNSRPDVLEPTTEVQESRRRPIGDFGEQATEEDVIKTATTEIVIEDTSQKPSLWDRKRNQSKVFKVPRPVDITSERLRKRKYPLKKYTTEKIQPEATTVRYETVHSSEPYTE